MLLEQKGQTPNPDLRERRGNRGQLGQGNHSTRYLLMDATLVLNLNILRVGETLHTEKATDAKATQLRDNSAGLRTYTKSSTW